MQGNLFVWDYGLLGKGDINWEETARYGWVDGTIWVLFCILTVFCFKRLFSISTLVSTVIVTLQLAYSIFLVIQQPEILEEGKKRASFYSPPEEIFQYSSSQNIIHVILDELQSGVFQEIVEGDYDYYSRMFEGFTFFKETAGSFPTTIMSLPAFMSGKIYKNDVPIRDFIDTIFTGKTVSNTLYENGYEVDLIIPIPWYSKGKYTNSYQIPVPYGESVQLHEARNALFMLELVLFRHSPHFLKKILTSSQFTFSFLGFQNKKTEHYEAERHFAHKAFLTDMTDHMSIGRSRPVYKLIHVTTTHWPAVLNDDCQYAGEVLPWQWENIRVQAKCSLDHFLKLLKKLKMIGVYDDSFIIIQADHGYWHIPESSGQFSLKNVPKKTDTVFKNREYFAQVVCSSNPLLAVKPPRSNGALVYSDAQTQLTDIPATITSFLDLEEGFPGKSVFEIDESVTRERPFHYYDRLNRKGDAYFERMDEYIISGPVSNRNSWRFVKPLSTKEKYQVTKIDFGTKDSGRFMARGWSNKEMEPKENLTYCWALGSSSSLFLSIPKNRRVLLTAKMKSARFTHPQKIGIKIDGARIGSWELTSSAWNWKKPWIWEERSMVIEPNEERPDISWIEFLFSHYRQPDERESRPLAVLFESISLNEFRGVNNK
jgi:hypothetical protein